MRTQPRLTTAGLIRALGHDLASQGFDADFIREAQLVALDRVMQIDDGLSISEEAFDAVQGPSEDQ